MQKYTQGIALYLFAALGLGMFVSGCTKKDWELAEAKNVENGKTHRLSGASDGRVLDLYPGAAAAYSLRKINGEYTGFCVEVRRSSDNTLKSIGFVNGLLDTASLLAFGGNDDVFVRRWFSQVAGSANLLQSANANQPLIASGGTMISFDGEPGIAFDANQNQFLTRGFQNADGRISIFGWFSQWTTGMIATVNINNTTGEFAGFFIGSGSERSRYRTFSPAFHNGVQRRTNMYSGIFNGTNYTLWRNGVAAGSVPGTAATFTNGTLRVGARSSANLAASGIAHSFVVYNNDQTLFRSGIENAFYDLYKKDASFDVKTFLTPDAAGSLTGKGFTITGLVVDEEETAARTDGKIVLWAGNHGEIQQPPYENPPQTATLVKVAIDLNDNDFTTAEKLDEIPVFSNPNFMGGSIQGVTVAPDGTLWFVGVGGASKTAIYHFTKNGAFLNRFSVPGANGIAFNPNNNTLLVLINLNTVVAYSPEGELLPEVNFPVPVADMLYFDAAENVLYLSRGANGKAGTYSRYTLNGTLLPNESTLTFSRVLAAEGIHVMGSYLFYASDAFYHPAPAPDDINAIHVYRIR